LDFLSDPARYFAFERPITAAAARADNISINIISRGPCGLRLPLSRSSSPFDMRRGISLAVERVWKEVWLFAAQCFRFLSAYATQRTHTRAAAPTPTTQLTRRTLAPHHAPLPLSCTIAIEQ